MNRLRNFCQRLQFKSAVAAGSAMLLASVAAGAVTIDNKPVQTLVQGVPPNIMLLLDDSGSMTWSYMYNPDVGGIEYKWSNGTTYTSRATGDGINYDATYLSYYYWSNGNAYAYDSDDDRATWGIYDLNPITNALFYDARLTYQPWSVNGTPLTGGKNMGSVFRDNNNVTINGVTNGLAGDLRAYYFYYFLPKSNGMTNAQLRDIQNYYRFRADYDNNGNARVQRCEYSKSKGNWDWADCVLATPKLADGSQRSAAAELNNLATWYSYHRTRMKSAKAGISQVFSKLGAGYRVGLRTLHNNSNVDMDIPVTSNSGLFEDRGGSTNRSTWFNNVLSAKGENGTPLRSALKGVGEYFSGTRDSGPWGPKIDGAQISCRQNFVIATTDGYWNTDSTSDINLGNVDNSDGTAIQSPDGKLTFQYSPSRPFMDDNSNSLADVAMNYWNKDLRTDLANNVARSANDPAFWQHMVTFGVSIGLKGTLNPGVDLPALKSGTKSWPDISAEDNRRIDDLWHATVNGHGQFVAATNPQKFEDALTASLGAVFERLGSGSNVAANSTSIETDTAVYQASYESGSWSGNLAAYRITASGVVNVDADNDGRRDALWEATQNVPAYGSRKVFFWSNNGGDVFPNNAAKSQLARTEGEVTDVTGQENADYILGSSAKERRSGGELRDRKSVLGDIVNSSPVFVQGTSTIFVGGNDGMLHAFDSNSGAERFAYIPAGVSLDGRTGLGALSYPNYQHAWTVDGQIAVTDPISGNRYLVAGMGRGGKGMFGLDVTTPSSFTKQGVKWDNTGSRATGNWGYVIGQPRYVTLNDGSGGGVPAIVVGNGINSANGVASLFIVNPATGAVIKELSTGVGGDNGLIEVGYELNPQTQRVDYLYGGDLKGNVWKFDLSGGTASWTIANNGAAWFQAQAGQPITGGFTVKTDPSNSANRWVFFGTGQLLGNADLTTSTVQSVYGVIDDGTTTQITALTQRGFAGDAQLINGRLSRSFEAHAALPSGSRGWYINLNQPQEGERVVTRPFMFFDALIFSSVIPPANNTCEPGGRGYLNGLDAFTGTSTERALFDTNGDGKFDSADMLTFTTGGTSVSIGTGSIDLGVGMPTQALAVGNQIVTGGTSATLGDLTANPPPNPGTCLPNDPNCQPGNPPPGASGKRMSWKEIIRE